MKRDVAGLAALLLVISCAGGPPVAGVASSPPAAPAQRSSCVAVDSAYALGTPVYRACGVDREATMRGRPRGTDWRPTPGGPSCYRADIEFVVDESGKPVPGTTRVIRSTDFGFAEAVQAAAMGAMYQPAMKDGVPVKQVVGYGQAAVAEIRVSGQPSVLSRPRVRC